MACKIGDKPRIEYSFGGEPGIPYQSFVSPIDVSVDSISSDGENFHSNGFGMSVYSTNNFRTLNLVLLDYAVVDTGVQGVGRYVLRIRNCGTDNLFDYTNIDPSSIVIDTSVHCPVAAAGNQKGRIRISAAGTTNYFFSATGNYPAKATVICGNCPPGTCECHSDSYPGYCCNDCSATSASLQNISNQLKRLKNG